MKKLLIILAAALILLPGCSTKSALQREPGATAPAQGSQFRALPCVDQSNYTFKDEKDQFSLAEAMDRSLQTSLTKNSLFAAESGYKIKTTILEYAPGNAFARWILPGAGATRLKVNGLVLDADDREVARIPVERTIAAGGGYTINAWQYVFDEVADEMVKVLKEQLLAKAQ